MITKCGGKEGFEEMKAAGDVYMQVCNGRERWYYHTSVESRSVGFTDKSITNVGTKKMDRKEARKGDYKIDRVGTSTREKEG